MDAAADDEGTRPSRAQTVLAAEYRARSSSLLAAAELRREGGSLVWRAALRLNVLTQLSVVAKLLPHRHQPFDVAFGLALT